MRIYTRTGDSGETGLLNGSRVPKDDPRVEASGAIDELSAVVGLAVAHVADAASGDVLRSIQRDLFALGARLADPADRMEVRAEKAQLTRDHVARLEQWIDESEAELPPLGSFLLPGGGPGAATLHLARAVCRRAERAIVSLDRERGVGPLVLEYVNRLSDLLFVLARRESFRAGGRETTW